MGFLASAAQGDLPLSLVLNAVHGIFILYFCGVNTPSVWNWILSPFDIAGYFTWPKISAAFFSVHIVFNFVALVYLVGFYTRTVRMVWNKHVPAFGSSEHIRSFYNYLLLVRPMAILWRRATARFRVLPDVLILGEVRCGTTSLAQRLTAMPGCHTPFCPWKHPELDAKETFYFVGHYENTTPFHYRMCFPLALTKWFYTRVLGRPFFTFDGCAQYLTSPTTPYLLASAYLQAGQPPPVLLACVRDPTSQAVSWWRYENGAIAWGEGMGLTNQNVELRTRGYFSNSIQEALRHSLSPIVADQYARAEEIGKQVWALAKQGAFPQINALLPLPPFALTWPGGQLTGIGRNGKFADNIARYERVFAHSFPPLNSDRPNAVTVVNLTEQNFVPSLQGLLRLIGERVGLSRVHLEQVARAVDGRTVKRNAGSGPAPGNLEPSSKHMEELRSHFADQKQKMETLTGRQMIGWH